MRAGRTAVAVAIWLPLLAVPAFADCISDVRSVMSRLAQAGPQRIVSTFKTKAWLVAVVSEKVPGAVHYSNYRDDTVTEYTVVDGSAWSRTNGGDWAELSAEDAADLAGAEGLDGVETFDHISDAQCLGTDVGALMTRYRLTYRKDGVLVRAEVDASSDAGLPRRIWSRSVSVDKVLVDSAFTYDPAIMVTAPF